MRLKLISCEIFEREVRGVQARSSNQVDVEFLSKIPHQLSDHETAIYFQSLIDRFSASQYQFQAILLVAGSCRHSLTGVRARSIPLVLPRVKDCISLLLSTSNAPHFASPPPLFPSPDQQVSSIWENRATAYRRPQAELLFSRGLLDDGIQSQRPNFNRQFRAKLRGSRLNRINQHHRRLNVLEMLVNGYWNYSEFLVVPAGWRVVVSSPDGMLSAEDTPL